MRPVSGAHLPVRMTRCTSILGMVSRLGLLTTARGDASTTGSTPARRAGQTTSRLLMFDNSPKVNPNGYRVESDLGESAAILQDSLPYTFTLGANIKWQKKQDSLHCSPQKIVEAASDLRQRIIGKDFWLSNHNAKGMKNLDQEGQHKQPSHQIQRDLGEKQHYVCGVSGNATVAIQPWVKNFNDQTDYGRGAEYVPRLWLADKK